MTENTENNKIILIVDDEQRNLKLLEAMLLPYNYSIILVQNGTEAIEKVHQFLPDVILLDIMMPGKDGFEVAKELKSDQKTKRIPIVMVTALGEVETRVKALEAGANDFLTKPVDKTELRARIKSLCEVKEYHDHMLNYQYHLESEVRKRTEELQEAYNTLKEASIETIRRLSYAAEYKDVETGNHIKRMSLYTSLLAKTLKLDSEFIEIIEHAAPMHDIGKIGIPDKILLKPGKLNSKEWQIMKQHPGIGSTILESSRLKLIQVARSIALTHHEKWDGSGYPNGLKEEEIPIEGRITAIADVFDALTSKRPYKEPYPFEKSISIIQQNRGTHFDPKITDAFLSKKDKIKEICSTMEDFNPSKFTQIIAKMEDTST